MYIAQKGIEAIALEEISDIGLEDTTDLALKVVKMVVVMMTSKFHLSQQGGL